MKTRILLSVLLVATLALPAMAENGCAAPQAALTTPLQAAVPAGDAVAEPIAQAIGQPCGNVTCGIKEYCCNPTCDACLPFGMSCTQEVCDSGTLTTTKLPEELSGTEIFRAVAETSALTVICGRNVCQSGEFCCNPSCGICAPFGSACTDVVCPPEE